MKRSPLLMLRISRILPATVVGSSGAVRVVVGIVGCRRRRLRDFLLEFVPWILRRRVRRSARQSTSAMAVPASKQRGIDCYASNIPECFGTSAVPAQIAVI
jgi:hypothetical protein